jgi:mannose-6-phosphate isomerase-like protein (cupin superfamily)
MKGKKDMQSTHQQPYAVIGEEGQALWFLGVLTQVKATGEQTRGAYGLIEQVLPAGFASPWHMHHDEDETFYVIEGKITLLCGDARIAAGPGTWAFGPRGIPHGFRVEGNVPARLLLLTTPSGFEQFIVEMSEPAADPSTPPTTPPDMEKLMAVAAKYHIDILGPLPE